MIYGIKIPEEQAPLIRSLYPGYIPTDWCEGYQTFWFRSIRHDVSKIAALMDEWDQSDGKIPYCCMIKTEDEVTFRTNSDLKMTVQVYPMQLAKGKKIHSMPWGYSNHILQSIYGWGDHQYGILNFSHEGDVYFDMKKKHLVFMGGSEMNCSNDWEWKPSEQEQFEEAHPGMLGFIEKLMNGNVEHVEVVV